LLDDAGLRSLLSQVSQQLIATASSAALNAGAAVPNARSSSQASASQEQDAEEDDSFPILPSTSAMECSDLTLYAQMKRSLDRRPSDATVAHAGPLQEVLETKQQQQQQQPQQSHDMEEGERTDCTGPTAHFAATIIELRGLLVSRCFSPVARSHCVAMPARLCTPARR
jgi:ribosomal protein L12E/L44/L45/RPP1/RPP2